MGIKNILIKVPNNFTKLPDKIEQTLQNCSIGKISI